VVVLDFHFWLPGWAEPTEAAWREKQNTLLAGDDWIADGNYHATLGLRLERADTVVFLDTPWWICARRAFVRGLRSRSVDFELPDGCDQSRFRQVRDEWWLVWRIWRVHRAERERELKIISRHGTQVAIHVLRSKLAVRQFLDVCAPHPVASLPTSIQKERTLAADCTPKARNQLGAEAVRTTNDPEADAAYVHRSRR